MQPNTNIMSDLKGPEIKPPTSRIFSEAPSLTITLSGQIFSEAPSLTITLSGQVFTKEN